MGPSKGHLPSDLSQCFPASHPQGFTHPAAPLLVPVGAGQGSLLSNAELGENRGEEEVCV